MCVRGDGPDAAESAENKELIMLQSSLVPTLRNLEMADDGHDPLRHQVRFAARWSLDNLCACASQKGGRPCDAHRGH